MSHFKSNKQKWPRQVSEAQCSTVKEEGDARAPQPTLSSNRQIDLTFCANYHLIGFDINAKLTDIPLKGSQLFEWYAKVHMHWL